MDCATRSIRACAYKEGVSIRNGCRQARSRAAQARYTGYRSFQYLEAGVDYREFKLAREVERVPSSERRSQRRAGSARPEACSSRTW